MAFRGVVAEPASLVTHWQADGSKGLGFKPAFQNPSTEINQHYSLDGRVVGLYLGYYQYQDYGRKLVSSNNVLVVGKDPHWELVASGRQRLIWGEHVLEVRTAELRSAVQPALANQKNLVVWQFYWIGGQVTANDHLAKVYGALNRLSGRSDGSAVIVASTLKDQTGDTDSLLTSFLTTHQGAINDLLLAMGKSPG